MAKNFKPGQRVVYTGKFTSVDKRVIRPKNGEIVTLVSMADHENWHVKEYPYGKNGEEQALWELNLEPIINAEHTAISYRVKLEPRKVLEEINAVMPMMEQ